MFDSDFIIVVNYRVVKRTKNDFEKKVESRIYIFKREQSFLNVYVCVCVYMKRDARQQQQQQLRDMCKSK